MIYCPSCGTGNRDGSRFCNECGTKLPTMTSSLCPTCGTPNPPHSLFCEKCGTRLVASLADEPEAPEAPAPSALVPKGLSLPTKSAAEAEASVAASSPVIPPSSADQAKPPEEELPDWMQVVQSAVAGTSELDISKVEAMNAASDESAPEEIPAWLSDLGLNNQTGPLKKTPTDELLPEWTQRLRTMPEAAQPTAEDEEVPDWLKTLGATGQLPSTQDAPEAAPEETTPAPGPLPAVAASAAQDEEIPEWLKEPATPYFAAEPETPEIVQPPAEDMPDWLRDLRPAAPAEDALPDWLDELGVEEQPPAGSMALSTGDAALDWLSQLGATAPETPVTPDEPSAESAVAPDWMSSLRAAAPDVDTQPTEEAPEWVREAETQQPAFEETAASETPDWLSSLHETPSESESPAEEGAPDWLKGAGLIAGAAALSAGSEEEQPEEPAPQKPVTDWLSALRQSTPSIDEQPTEEAPAWLEETGAAPQAIGGVPSYDQEIPDWLREASAASQSPVASSEEEIPEWLQTTQAPVESVETQPTAEPEEEGIPDWLKGLGVAAAGAAAIGALTGDQAEEVEPQKPATDWLSTLRQATPEMEAEQAEAEEEIPDWLREDSGAAPQAIGGVQAYDRDVPDWLREEPVATAPDVQPAATEAEEEEGVHDWLKGLGAVAGAAAVAAARTDEPSDEDNLPDWLRETEPVPAITFEAPEEEAAAEQPVQTEEAEQAEETSETEPELEEESWVSKAAPIAAAGLAVAAVAGADRKPEESASVEMPEWLKEIRQEQEVARTTIPVPPAEPTGLTQAEIPAWLEALRPTEEAGALKEDETPSETEGPLAGIANALPPAPMMGQMTGLPAKLQFTVSAEDQARAGVLKELLTQHAVAPASVEQFLVKSSVIRRRMLRWVVAFLIIAALMVPIGLDLNQITGLPLLASAQKMVPIPAVYSAALEIAKVAQQPDRKVLIVFDYDASQAGEMNRVAAALLKSPALRSAELEIASLNPQGSAVARAVLKDFPDLHFVDRGFTPGQINGVQSVLNEVGKVSLIIDLAASPESVRWWAEQLKANRNETPLVAGVSAGAEPLTAPYLESGQVKGLVSGFPGAVVYLNAAQQMNTYSQDQIKQYQIPLDALALANYVMVALMVVGLIAALVRGTGRRSA